MSRFDAIGLFWEDLPSSRKGGPRELGPMPAIPETGWQTPRTLPDLRRAPVMSFDTETFDPDLTTAGPGWARGKGHICGFSVATPDTKIYVPIRHEVQSDMNFDPDTAFRWMQAMMAAPCPKVGANLMYDIGWLRQEGVEVSGELYDVQFAEALLDESSKVNLEALGRKYCGIGKDVDILKEWCRSYYGTGEKNWRKDIYRAPVSLVGAYGEMDAALPLMVIQQQYPLLVEQGLLDLFKMENKLIRLLVDMRFAGVSVDTDYAEQLSATFKDEAAAVQKRIDYMAGFSVNVNAADSLAKAFTKFGLSFPKTEKGAPSFVKEFLENHDHEFANAVTELRGIEKLRGTFVEGYLLKSHVNGKVHAQFHPLSGTDGGTKTGRLSSSDPNLQNIPTRTAVGKLIRKAFVPDAGHLRWRKYDYSQIEYRFLAHFAVGQGADDIREKYRNDPTTDYHQAVMDLIYLLTGTALQRGAAKNINFGIVYGMGNDKLARDLNLAMEAAKELLAAYHKGAPFVKETMKATMEFAEQHGYNLTILNRRTRFELWEPEGWGARGIALPYAQATARYGHVKRAYLYKALNYRLQGSAADMMKAGMVKCYEDGIFAETGIPRLTVHDELDFSDAGGKDEAFREMQNIMQNIIPLKVPVLFDCEIGPNWGDVKEV